MLTQCLQRHVCSTSSTTHPTTTRHSAAAASTCMLSSMLLGHTFPAMQGTEVVCCWLGPGIDHVQGVLHPLFFLSLVTPVLSFLPCFCSSFFFSLLASFLLTCPSTLPPLLPLLLTFHWPLNIKLELVDWLSATVAAVGKRGECSCGNTNSNNQDGGGFGGSRVVLAQATQVIGSCTLFLLNL